MKAGDETNVFGSTASRLIYPSSLKPKKKYQAASAVLLKLLVSQVLEEVEVLVHGDPRLALLTEAELLEEELQGELFDEFGEDVL